MPAWVAALASVGPSAYSRPRLGPPMLDADQFRFWQDHGYLVLPKFYREVELQQAEAALRDAWLRDDPNVVVDDLVTNRRCLLSALSAEERTHRFKTNDLYLVDDRVRQLALGERMAPILASLLGQTPVLCNSLSFDQGSAQTKHIDSLYMTPVTRGHLCAIWVALEDAAPEAGPLFYYPGSHKIPPFRFSNGSFHTVVEEMGTWHAHMDEHIATLGLSREVFCARAGDVFVWSADLLHGGSPIEDAQKTRKSVVFHYYSKPDVDVLGDKVVPINGAYWMQRARQLVPEDVGAKAGAAPAGPGRELRLLRRRVEKLEAELARIKKDPLGVRLAAARARKVARQYLARLKGRPAPLPRGK